MSKTKAKKTKKSKDKMNTTTFEMPKSGRYSTRPRAVIVPPAPSPLTTTTYNQGELRLADPTLSGLPAEGWEFWDPALPDVRLRILDSDATWFRLREAAAIFLKTDAQGLATVKVSAKAS